MDSWPTTAPVCSISLFNYSEGNLNALETLHNSDNILMGLSDAGAHCGAICDGGMPTFMLTHWARDRRRGPQIPLSESFSAKHMIQHAATA